MPTAQCHCGNITLSVQDMPDSLTSCNCSICHKIGALWAYFHPDQVQLEELRPSDRYCWGDHSIGFQHCPECGCCTHYVSLNTEQPRLAINARMFDRKLIQAMKTRQFDGADSWRYMPD